MLSNQAYAIPRVVAYIGGELIGVLRSGFAMSEAGVDTMTI